MLINHISVSRSKTYKECAQRYKYRYHLQTPSPVVEPFYFTYGKIIHRCAEVYVQEKCARSLGEISTDVQRGKILMEGTQKAPPIPEDYAKRMPAHLRAIQRLTSQIGTDGEIEYDFSYDLDPPNNKLVVGFIDRLIFKNNQAFIIDYKTTKKGKWRVNKNTIKSDVQLRCYARVVQREFGILPQNIKCALYYLEDAELIAASYSESSLLSVEKELLEMYDEIAATDPDTVIGKPGEYCSRCDYVSICPYRSRNCNKITQTDLWDGDMSKIPNFQKKM